MKRRIRQEEICYSCGFGEPLNSSDQRGEVTNASEVWIQCDVCLKWFHLRCVGLEEYETVLIDLYHCPDCQNTAGPSKTKKVLLRHRYKFDDLKERNKPKQVGTPEFIECFKKRERTIQPLTEDYAVTLNDGIDLSNEFEGRNSWSKIYLIRNKKGLGIGLPDSSFTVKDCIDTIGSQRMVSVIDVYQQQSYLMSLGRFYEKFNSEDRPRLYNILSLEFSDTKLNEVVFPPSLVTELSWVERYWNTEGFLEKANSPLSLEEHLKAKPEVLRYCLIGMAGSYTDFHIDFGGSSVWYHVFKGQKIFYVVPPTDANLKHYFDYHLEKNRSETFFGDRVDRNSLFRVVVSSGETLLIPSGWIHAVYTPVDTLVFGGNFLHSLNIEIQLKVYEMEVLLATEQHLMFPGFELINWFVASEMIGQVREINDDTISSVRSEKHLVKIAKTMVNNLILWAERKAVWQHLFGNVVPALQKELKNYEKKRQKESDARRKSTPSRRLKKDSSFVGQLTP